MSNVKKNLAFVTTLLLIVTLIETSNEQSQMQKLKLFFIQLSLSLRKLYSLSWQIKCGGVVC